MGAAKSVKGEPKRGKRPSRHHPPSGFSGIRAISHNRQHSQRGRLPPPGGPTRTPTGAPPPPCGRPGPPPSPTAARCAAGGSSAVGRPPPEGGGVEGGDGMFLLGQSRGGRIQKPQPHIVCGFSLIDFFCIGRCVSPTPLWLMQRFPPHLRLVSPVLLPLPMLLIFM